MTDKTISPLRRRMIEDMTVRHFTSKTQSDYIRAVTNLARFLRRSPDTASNEDLRLFQLHLTENRVGAPTINFTVSALRFFFTVTLDRTDAVRHLTFVHEPRKLPLVLSPEEVARFLEAAPGVKYKAAFSVAYGAGLRVSEVAALKVSDIDSKRMMLRLSSVVRNPTVALSRNPASGVLTARSRRDHLHCDASQRVRSLDSNHNIPKISRVSED